MAARHGMLGSERLLRFCAGSQTFLAGLKLKQWFGGCKRRGVVRLFGQCLICSCAQYDCTGSENDEHFEQAGFGAWLRRRLP